MQINQILKENNNLNNSSDFEISFGSSQNNEVQCQQKQHFKVKQQIKVQIDQSTSQFSLESENQYFQYEISFLPKNQIQNHKIKSPKQHNEHSSILELKELLDALSDIEETSCEQISNSPQINKVLQPRVNHLQVLKTIYPTLTKQIQRHHINSLDSQKSNRFHRQPFKYYHNNHIQDHQIKGKNDFASLKYYYFHTLIELKLTFFLKVKANALLVPFSSQKFEESTAKQVINKIQYNMKQILQKQILKSTECQIQDGNIFGIKSKGIPNFNGIYFMKSPFKISKLKYSNREMLNLGIKNLFNLLDRNQDENIIIPSFQWGNLQTKQISQLLIGSVFREINEWKKQGKCTNLHHLIIVISNCEDFQIYSNSFKQYLNCFNSTNRLKRF